MGDTQRPSSRNAGAFVVGGELSAREQEHVARATGGPFINMAGNNSRQNWPSTGGLVGAIEAREREKKDLKQGINSHAVQQAIAQRQRDSQVLVRSQTPQGLQQQQYPYQGQFTAPSQFMGSPQYPAMGQGYAVMTPGGSWGNPAMGYGPSPVEQQYQQQGYFIGPGQGYPQPQMGQRSPGHQGF